MIVSGDRGRWSIWSIAIAVMFPLGIFGFTRPVRDNSFLWHVRAGDAQRSLGAVLTEDPFSFTALGKPWRTQSWLPELAYSWLDERIGLTQIPWIILGCWLIVLTAVLAVVRRRCRSTLQTALLTAATVVILIGSFNPRPVIFSFVLMTLLILADEHPRLRWAIPLIMWVWVATHGSFPIGAAYLLFQAIRHRDRTRVAPIVMAGALSLLTAHGYGVLQILSDFGGGGGALDVIREWQTPNLLSPPFIPLLLGLFVLIGLGASGKFDSGSWWILVPFLALAFRANRTVPPAWLALLPILAIGTAAIPDKLGTAKISRFVPIGLGILGLMAIPIVAIPSELDTELFPVEASEHLEGTRVFTSDAAGGYLTYAYWPERLIFTDDRAELFHRELPQMVAIRGGAPEWREAFTEWQFDEAMLRRVDPLLEILVLSGWETAFADESWVVLTEPAG